MIIYGSQYGTTEQYAKELAKRTGLQAMPYDSVKSLAGCDTVIYLGGLYAGGILGLKKTFAKYPIDDNCKIIIVTVGLADPNDQVNTDRIKAAMKNQVPEAIYDRAIIFHLRGGIDYSKLNLKHKVMMGLLFKKIQNMPEEEKTAEVRAMIETYNKTVDFVDFSTLDDIVKECGLFKPLEGI